MTNTTMIKLFIFDNDGVMNIYENRIAVHFAAMGYCARDLASVGPRTKEAEINLMLGLIDEKQFWIEVEKDLYRKEGYKISLKDLLSGCPVDGIKQTVSDLKERGYRVVLGTNIITPYWEKCVSEGCFDIFDALYASCEMHVCKPDTLFYKKIALNEGIALNEAMLIDDCPENIASAKNTGMNTHLFRSTFHLRNTLEQMGYL